MVHLVPMNEADLARYLAAAVPDFARDKVDSGQWSPEAALGLSQRDFDGLLPQGLATPDNHLYSIRDPGTSSDVGMLWYAVQERAGKRIAYVYDVLIRPEFQRRGHATHAFAALEQEVAARGLSGIALHVFGHNARAIALYDRLGFRPTNINMFKAVG